MTRAQPKVAAYPFTTLGAGAGHDRRRRPPARPRRHPGADRGRLGGRRASATTSSRTSSARGCSSTCSTSRRWTAPTRSTNFEVIERELAEHDPRLAVAAAAAGAVEGRSRAARGGRGGRGGVARAGRVPGARDVERDRPRAGRAARRAARARAGRRAGARGRGRGRGGRVRGLPPAAKRAGVRRSRAGPTASWIVTGDAVERLFVRWDLENEEAQALRRAPAAAHGRDRGARAGGLRAGRRRRDRRHRLRAGPVAECRSRSSSSGRRSSPRTPARCGCPSSRGSARRSRRCTRPGSTWSSSPRARSRAASTCSGWAGARGRSRSCRRRRAVGQGRLYRTYDEYLRERGIQSAQVLLTFFDMSARTHYLNARRTLRKLVEWRIVPVINENDTTTTDEISFGDNDFLAAQVAVLVDASLLLLLTSTPGLFTADPRVGPVRAAGRDGRRPRRAGGAVDLHRDVAAGLGRDALEGRGGRDGDRGRHPDRDRQRVRAGRAGAGLGGRGGRHALRAAPGAPALVQALAASTRSRRRASVVVDAGAARALRDGGTSLLPVGIVSRRRRVRGRRRVDVRVADGDAVGKGISNYSAAELRRVMGMKSGAVREVLPAGDRGSRAPRLLRPGRSSRRTRRRRRRGPRARTPRGRA